MNELLQRCNKNLRPMPCCHADGRTCFCYNCLKSGFFEKPDTYACKKKANFYVLNYGPSYVSEIYYYLKYSRILEKSFQGQTIRVMSLGCGFAPDLLALETYRARNNLHMQINYHGIDSSEAWQEARYTTSTSIFSLGDVTQSINLASVDIVFVVKLFSTLFSHRKSDAFLVTFCNAIRSELRNGGYVVFGDINSKYKGRDDLLESIVPLFTNIRAFYFSDDKYKPPNTWIKIPETSIVFSIPSGLNVPSKPNVCDTFFFECRK